MLRNIVVVALVAGFAGGLALTAMQAVKVLPLIQEAEVYESAAAAPEAAAHSHAVGEPAHVHDEEEWEPAEGFERFGLTLAANVIVGIGFALLLAGAAAWRGGITWRQGLLWGLAGYAAFHMAPSLGLPPELPGMAAAGLVERQVWWLATAVATAGGIALIVFGRPPIWKILGVALILAPQFIGVPHHAGTEHGLVPPELAATFVSATLVANMLFWLVLGGVAGYMFDRVSKPALRS